LSLGLRGILVLDLGNGMSGFAKSNEHSLGEMNTFFVAFRDLVPRRAVPRAETINESGSDGACYDNRGSSDISVSRCLSLGISRFGRYDGSSAPCASIVVSAKTDRYRFCHIPFQQSRLFGAVERDGDYGSSAVLKVASRPAMLA
jgi:hypothetical protein